MWYLGLHVLAQASVCALTFRTRILGSLICWLCTVTRFRKSLVSPMYSKPQPAHFITYIRFLTSHDIDCLISNTAPQLNWKELPSMRCIHNPHFFPLHFFTSGVIVVESKRAFVSNFFKFFWLTFTFYECIF